MGDGAGVAVWVGEAVEVPVAVGDAVEVAVAGAIGVLVDVAMNVLVGVAVAVAVGELVRVGVAGKLKGISWLYSGPPGALPPYEQDPWLGPEAAPEASSTIPWQAPAGPSSK